MEGKNGGETPVQPGPGRKGGRSSFWMHDPQAVFEKLQLVEGGWFLDAGCGPGDYSLQAAGIVGEGGRVYALDRSLELIRGLRLQARAQGRGNIAAVVADITAGLPLADGSIDTCLLSTVVHVPAVRDACSLLFAEVRRVLRPAGRVAVIECHKREMPFGPPMHMRLSPDELGALLSGCGYRRTDLVDLGYNYMALFSTV